MVAANLNLKDPRKQGFIFIPQEAQKVPHGRINTFLARSLQKMQSLQDLASKCISCKILARILQGMYSSCKNLARNVFILQESCKECLNILAMHGTSAINDIIYAIHWKHCCVAEWKNIIKVHSHKSNIEQMWVPKHSNEHNFQENVSFDFLHCRSICQVKRSIANFITSSWNFRSFPHSFVCNLWFSYDQQWAYDESLIR